MAALTRKRSKANHVALSDAPRPKNRSIRICSGGHLTSTITSKPLTLVSGFRNQKKTTSFHLTPAARPDFESLPAGFPCLKAFVESLTPGGMELVSIRTRALSTPTSVLSPAIAGSITSRQAQRHGQPKTNRDRSNQ